MKVEILLIIEECKIHNCTQSFFYGNETTNSLRSVFFNIFFMFTQKVSSGTSLTSFCAFLLWISQTILQIIVLNIPQKPCRSPPGVPSENLPGVINGNPAEVPSKNFLRLPCVNFFRSFSWECFRSSFWGNLLDRFVEISPGVFYGKLL